jgi:hypothetical protein
MGKVIMYDISELTWVTYNTRFDEKDYQDFLDYMDLNWIEMYNVFKEIPFDKIVDIMNGDADDINFSVKSRWSDRVYGTSVYDEIEQWMRDKAYENGIEDYGDCIDVDYDMYIREDN